MDIQAEIGDIWRFDAPPWHKNDPDYPAHYMIQDIIPQTRGPDRYWYVCLHLETGHTVPDLLIDYANVENYNARKVA